MIASERSIVNFLTPFAGTLFFASGVYGLFATWFLESGTTPVMIQLAYIVCVIGSAFGIWNSWWPSITIDNEQLYYRSILRRRTFQLKDIQDIAATPDMHGSYFLVIKFRGASASFPMSMYRNARDITRAIIDGARRHNPNVTVSDYAASKGRVPSVKSRS